MLESKHIDNYNIKKLNNGIKTFNHRGTKTFLSCFSRNCAAWKKDSGIQNRSSFFNKIKIRGFHFLHNFTTVHQSFYKACDTSKYTTIVHIFIYIKTKRAVLHFKPGASSPAIRKQSKDIPHCITFMSLSPTWLLLGNIQGSSLCLQRAPRQQKRLHHLADLCLSGNICLSSSTHGKTCPLSWSVDPVSPCSRDTGWCLAFELH